jgi:hypothetical protein
VILAEMIKESYMSKTVFDVDNKVHLKEVGYFMKYNKWRNRCPFFLEHPYTNVPAMIKDKLAMNLVHLVE